MNQGASDIKFIELKDTIDRLSKVIDRQNSVRPCTNTVSDESLRAQHLPFLRKAL